MPSARISEIRAKISGWNVPSCVTVVENAWVDVLSPTYCTQRKLFVFEESLTGFPLMVVSVSKPGEPVTAEIADGSFDVMSASLSVFGPSFIRIRLA